MTPNLCYGDSNTHGPRPIRLAGVSERHGKSQSWPDLMAVALGPALEAPA